MNSPITFPPPAPVLKLVRPSAEKWAATLAEERRRLQEDHEALREREANLRDYEARLRALQAEIEASRPAATLAAVMPRAHTPLLFQRASSRAPFADDPVLQSGWEKLHRAREILEAEQNHLRDDRIALREIETAIKRREEAVALREARLAQREAQVECEEHAESTMTRLTNAPFKIARAVLLGKK